MDRILFDKSGEAKACIADDYNQTIYLWDGSPVAYVYHDRQVYGINGRYLGWFIEEIIYNKNGKRVGFTSASCPVPISKVTGKSEKRAMDQIRPKWSAPPTPKLAFNFAEQDLADFLKEGQVVRYRKEVPPEESTQ